MCLCISFVVLAQSKFKPFIGKIFDSDGHSLNEVFVPFPLENANISGTDYRVCFI